MNSDTLIASLAREYCRLAKNQGLISQYNINETTGIEITATGEQEAENLPLMDSIIFIRGMMAGAKAAATQS